MEPYRSDMKKPIPVIFGVERVRSFRILAARKRESLRLNPKGEVAEWLKAHAWKACIL